MTTLQPKTCSKIPVFQTIGHAISFPFSNFGAFWRIALLPLVLMGVGFFCLADRFTHIPNAVDLARMSFYWKGFGLFLLGWGYLMLTVGWTRYIVLGETLRPIRMPGGFRELKVIFFILLYEIGVHIILMLLMFIPIVTLGKAALAPVMGVIGIVGCVVGFGVYLFICIRMSLLTVNLSVDQTHYRATYLQTKGNIWRLIALTVVSIPIHWALLLVTIFSLGVMVPFLLAFGIGTSAFAYKYLQENSL